MSVSDVDFGPLIAWCTAGQPSPYLAPRVGGYLRLYDNNEGGTSLVGQYEGSLSYRPGRGNRFFPAHFGGTLRSIASGYELVTVAITLGQPTEDLLSLAFAGGLFNGKFVEVDAGLLNESSDPKILSLSFKGEQHADSYLAYFLDLWQTYGYTLAP